MGMEYTGGRAVLRKKGGEIVILNAVKRVWRIVVNIVELVRVIMRQAGGFNNGPVGAIYQANIAGGEIEKGMQEGKVTRVEVWGDLLQMTGHIRVISHVEHRQGWKHESHDILGHDARGLAGLHLRIPNLGFCPSSLEICLPYLDICLSYLEFHLPHLDFGLPRLEFCQPCLEFRPRCLSFCIMFLGFGLPYLGYELIQIFITIVLRTTVIWRLSPA